MNTKAKTPALPARRIVQIDEAKCTGCGLCIMKCAEGALKIIDGKARLVSDTYCDGLGACLGECPEGAITIIEREAAVFDEEAVKAHLHPDEGPLPCGCPSATLVALERTPARERPPAAVRRESRLANWPVQLRLVPPSAAFLRGSDLMLAAHCVPFACAGFHEELLDGHTLLVACPKLDDFEAHQAKLKQVLAAADIASLTVVHMEVPCCSGLVHMAKQAIAASGKGLPLREVTIGVDGRVIG